LHQPVLRIRVHIVLLDPERKLPSGSEYDHDQRGFWFLKFFFLAPYNTILGGTVRKMMPAPTPVMYRLRDISKLWNSKCRIRIWISVIVGSRSVSNGLDPQHWHQLHHSLADFSVVGGLKSCCTKQTFHLIQHCVLSVIALMMENSCLSLDFLTWSSIRGKRT
jgi:hypothetical protein